MTLAKHQRSIDGRHPLKVPHLIPSRTSHRRRDVNVVTSYINVSGLGAGPQGTPASTVGWDGLGVEQCTWQTTTLRTEQPQ